MGQVVEFSQENDRRQRISQTIDRLLEERQQVLVNYWGLAGVNKPEVQRENQCRVTSGQLQSFCQILVDYTALGHFEIYQRIIEGKERRTAVQKVAHEVYPAIAETTDHLIDFNDKYDGTDEGDYGELPHDLSRIGEMLAVRGELEDRLLAALRRA